LKADCRVVIAMYNGARDIRRIVVRLVFCIVLLFVYAACAGLASRGLEVTHTALPVSGLPQALDGLTIVQITDLHSSRFGEGQSELIGAVRDAKPDLIVITGDFIDGVWPDPAPCEELVRGLAAIAPVYRVRGNHEYYLGSQALAAFDAGMAAEGAVLLVNNALALEKNGVSYLLGGMDDVAKNAYDPNLETMDREQFEQETAQGFMADLAQNTPAGQYPLKIMLCHQPPFWQLWRDAGYDIALCGHLHGWVARLPGIGGVLRNPSRYFPEEDAGLYDKQGIMVYISRGLNNRLNWRNLRMNNKPELSVLTVTRK
jgi:uncharacterized protein